MSTENDQATDDLTKTKCAPGGDLSPSICSGYSVAERWWQTTLESAPPGLFLFAGAWGFKTEYGDENGPEAYCVDSGEYFWGGTSDKEVRRKLLVQPVIICPNAKVCDESPSQTSPTKTTRAGSRSQD